MTWQALVCAAALLLTAPAMAIADSARFNIVAQPLPTALRAFAEQAKMQLLYQPGTVDRATATPVAGDLDKHAALEQLLRGTGLEAIYSTENAATIRPIRAVPTVDASSPAAGTSGTSDGDVSDKIAGSNPKSTFWDRFRLAEVDQGTSSNSSSVERKTDQASQKKPDQLEEVVVTAQKKTENLLDVPVPVTAISAQTLVDTNQLRLQDYYTSIPGLIVTPSDINGAPQLAIRGVATGTYTNPTVGITVDDVPYGASTSLAGGSLVPDIDPSDLARVEVLRGPQGTLYGASSIGGLLKYVTVDPSTDGVSGRVQAGTSSVYNGAELGYSFRGSVNVPLSDTLAVRASGFTREDPGYIDNVQAGERGINREDAYGGRLSALWRPSEVFSLKLSALYQDSKTYGSNDVDLGLGDLQQNELRGTGGARRTAQAYSATLTAKLGRFDLTAVSGYIVDTLSDAVDDTSIFGSSNQVLFGVSGGPFTEQNKTNKFTQEIRLSAPIGQSIDWLIGAFYTHERSPYMQTALAEDPNTGAIVGTGAVFNWLVTYAEYAAFTDLTFHVTDRFDVQIGGRESHNRQTYSEVDTGPLFPLLEGVSSPLVFPQVVANENPFTYLVTPQFKVSPDLMAYARLASGFRPGGPNSEAAVFHLPLTFNPDTTKNYEIGVKGDVPGHAFSFDASLYYIDWKDIQLTVVTPSGSSYVANASEAKSQGVELSVESKPLTGLTIAAWVAWDDAELKKAFPPNTAAFGVAGDRLPFSSRFSGSFSLEKVFSLTSRVTGFVGGALSYVGDREGNFASIFTGSPERQIFPAYAKADARAGVTYDSWTVNFFVNNIADKRGVIFGGPGNSINPLAFQYIQPRTVGLSVAKTF